MPSDERVESILDALAPLRDAFRSAVTQAAEELRAYIESHRAPRNGRATEVEAELGVFAAGRIDVDRFAALLGQTDVLDDTSIGLLEQARGVLDEIARAGDAPFRATVPSGGVLVADVETALSLSGRAFGAARVAELVRSGRSAEAARDGSASAFPFARWTRAERLIAPPLLVEIDGGDLQVAGLAAYLDGSQKIALVVGEPAPPAPLVRLVTPGVFVMQTADPADFERFVDFEGPAVAALVPQECATFVHDPSRPAIDRLVVTSRPDAEPRRAVGRVSAFQQAEELKHLNLLTLVRGAGAGVAAGEPAVPPAAAAEGVQTGSPGEPGATIEPADRLAAWLLAQADLSDQG